MLYSRADEKHNLVSTDQNKLAELVKEANALHHTGERAEWGGAGDEVCTLGALRAACARRPPSNRPSPHRAVEKPRESAVDSELFAIVTESGVEFVRKLTSGARVRGTARWGMVCGFGGASRLHTACVAVSDQLQSARLRSPRHLAPPAHPQQARTPDDLLRRLRSRYVTRLDQQAAAEMQPSAFKW